MSDMARFIQATCDCCVPTLRWLTKLQPWCTPREPVGHAEAAEKRLRVAEGEQVVSRRRTRPRVRGQGAAAAAQDEAAERPN